MAESMMKLEVDVPKDASGTVTVVQYGMRYPDGTHKWGSDGDNQGNVWFKSLSEGKLLQHWESLLKRRATAARLDPVEYASNHIPVKRTIIVAAGEPEELPVSHQVTGNDVW